MSLQIWPANNPALSMVEIPSPTDIQWGTRNGETTVSLRGSFWGTNIANAATVRDDVLEIVDDLQPVNLVYSGDASFTGGYFIVRFQTSPPKLASAVYDWTMELLFLS